MPNYEGEKLTVCPFYVREADKSISCEGVIDGTVTMTRFASTEVKVRFQEAACFQYGSERVCPVAKQLATLYLQGDKTGPE